MPRQTLTKITPVGPYPTLPVSANSLDITFTAADTVNKEQFAAGADTLVLVWNTHATTTYTVTITSVADDKGRTGDVTTYSLSAGEIAAFRIRKPGWMQSDGNIYMEASNAAIKYAVLAL
jgi:hypothetical protein